MYLMPAFTALLAVIFLDERLHNYHVVGIGVIAFGIYLTNQTNLVRNPRQPT